MPSLFPAQSSRPRIRRSPLATTPNATSAAIDTTRLSSWTLRYVASSQRYAQASSPRAGRHRKASTSASSAAQIRPTLATAHALDAQRPHQIVKPAADHTRPTYVSWTMVSMAFSVFRRGLEQACQIRVIADPRDLEIDRAHAGVPVVVVVPVAVRLAVAPGRARPLGDPVISVTSAFISRLGEKPDALPQEVRLPVRAHLAEGLEQATCRCRPSWCSSVSSVSRSNDARTTRRPSHSRPRRCYTTRDTTPRISGHR